MTNDAEALAKQIVLHHLGGTVVGEDDGSAQGMVDLIVKAAAGPHVAIEVTRLMSQEQTKFVAAWAQFGGPDDTLTRMWRVRFLPSANIKQAQRKLPGLLRELETANRHEIDTTTITPSTQPFAERLNDLGIQTVHSMDGPGFLYPRWIVVGTAEASGKVLTDVATEVLTDPSRQDNASKLRNTGLDHRHLFIVVCLTAGPAYFGIQQALQQGFLPATPPTASPDYTGVWIAVDHNLPTARWTRESNWVLLDPPPN